MSENVKNQADNSAPNSGEAKKEKHSFWGKLFSEIGNRLAEPFSYPTFISIFIGVIIIAGGSGVWIPLIFTDLTELSDAQYKLVIASSLATYFLAIVATAFADLSLIFFEQLMDIKSEFREKRKISTLLSLWSVTFVGSIIVVVFGAISLIKKSNENISLGFAIAGTSISLLLWWIVNNDNKKLKESTFDSPQYNAGNTIGSNLSGQGVKDGTATF